MASLAMAWGGDLRRSAVGGLALSTGATSTNELIVRELLTTSNVLLESGVQANPDFYLLPGFGRSLRILVGQNATPDFISRLTQEITSVILGTPGVNPNVPPTIQTTTVGNAVLVLGSYELSDGTPASVAFQVSGSSP